MGLDWNYWRVEDGGGHHLAAEAPVCTRLREMRAVMAPLTGVPWALRRDDAVVTPALRDDDAPGDAVVLSTISRPQMAARRWCQRTTRPG